MKTFYKFFSIAFALSIILMCGISCRKEIYPPNSETETVEKQLLKQEDLLKVINENPAFKLFGLDWSKAKQAILDGKAVVRVPVENKVKFDISLFNPNQPSQKNVQSVGSTGKSPNYSESHPPEVFFIKEADSIRPYLLNFVPDKTSPKTGENGIWTGKLYEWNLKGDKVHVQDISDSKLKRNYLMEIGTGTSTNSDSRKVDGWIGDFFNWLGGIFRDVWDGINWLFYNLGIPGFYTYDDWDQKRYRTWEFGSGDDGGGGGSYGGGGGGGGGYYDAAGDPSYGGYLPGYRPADNFPYYYPGGDPFTPYPSGPNVGGTLYSASLNYLINNINLTSEQINFLAGRDDISQALENYLIVNGTSKENNDFVQWAVGYLYVNRFLVNINQFLTEFFPVGPELVADPNADNWIDPDNTVLFDPDHQTVYQQYQDSQPWPTVKRDDVMAFEKFVPIRKRADNPNKYVNCLILAKEQLDKVGYTCSGYSPGDQTFSIYTEQNGVNLPRTKQAISYIISALSQKIPVLIGVDNRIGTPSSINADGSTDHFVVIVGMGTDEKGRYFQFVDNATNNRSTGASYSNRLYYNSITGKITGRTAVADYRNIAGMHDYIVTQVRKSIKK